MTTTTSTTSMGKIIALIIAVNISVTNATNIISFTVPITFSYHYCCWHGLVWYGIRKWRANGTWDLTVPRR